MQRQYLISKSGNQIGPMKMEEVLLKLSVQHFNWLDCVYSEVEKEWVALRFHPDFQLKYKEGFGRPKIQPDFSKLHSEKEWALYAGDKNIQIYSYQEMLQLIQGKSVFNHDFLWGRGFDDWKCMVDVDVFRPEQIKKMLAAKNPMVLQALQRREHVRTKFESKLIVHNNKTVFKGSSLEISAGGAGVLIETQQLQPGQSVFLHLQSNKKEIPPFNAIGNIVSKQFCSSKADARYEVRYGIKFTNISQSIREHIKKYAEDKETQHGYAA